MNESDYNEDVVALQAWETLKSNFSECIFWFQRIENTLSICISAFAEIDEKIGDIITTEISFRTKVSILSALVVFHTDADNLHEDINNLFKRVRWAEQERNRLVHSIWDIIEDEPGYIQREKAALKKNRHKIEKEIYIPEDLDDLQRLFEGIDMDLIYLLSEHYPKMKDRLHY